MPTLELNIDLEAIQDDIAIAMFANNQIGIDNSYIDFCFQLKRVTGCDIINVKDLTDYTFLGRIDFLNSHIYASLYKIVGTTKILICAEVEYPINSVWQYADLVPGCYEVHIRVDFALENPIGRIQKDIVLCAELDCCIDGKKCLEELIIQKIAKLACTIENYKNIGRNCLTLIMNQHKLQAIYFALTSCYITCKDFECFKCSADQIITNCNC